MRRVVVLRPEPGASETVRRARERGLQASALPLFEIEPLEWVAPDPLDFDALVLTSPNAIRHGGKNLAYLRTLPVHAVGTATAETARSGGFEIRTVGEGGIDDLLERIDPDLRLLHLCGQDRRSPLAHRQLITAIPVYRATEVSLPRALAQAEGAVVLVHSPRAAKRFAELAQRLGLDRRSIAIGAISDVAAEAAGPGWATVEVAKTPTDDALLALAIRLCDKNDST